MALAYVIIQQAKPGNWEPQGEAYLDEVAAWGRVHVLAARFMFDNANVEELLEVGRLATSGHVRPGQAATPSTFTRCKEAFAQLAQRTEESLFEVLFFTTRYMPGGVFSARQVELLHPASGAETIEP